MKTIASIQESFNKEIRIFERYLKDIHRSILELNKQVKELESYVENGGSLNFPSQAIENSTARTVGMIDTPDVRRAVSYALENRTKELKEYIEISLTMAFSHFMTIFDSRYMDVISLFYECNPKLLKDVTLERKLMNFSYKSFGSQLNSIRQNLKIDFSKLLGDDRIEQLLEIRATRNIIVHNSSVVNDIYLAIVKTSPFSEGQKRPLTIEYFEKSTELMQMFFSTLCGELYEKLP